MNTDGHFPEYRIDPEFERLHVPVSDKVMKRLERNIIHFGAYKPVIVWQGFIIDGHKHYRICRSHGIPFKVQEQRFEKRNDVIEWLCDKNLDRDDITHEYRKYFIGKKFLARYAAANGYERADELDYDSRYLNKKCVIARDLSVLCEKSEITIMKYGRFAVALDAIFEKDPSFAGKILKGELKLPKESEMEISQLSADELDMILDYVNEKGGNKITLTEIRRVQRLYRTRPAVHEKKGLSPALPGIKYMPKYDPDAEIMSLALTIPSWKSSIERVQDKADLTCSSEKARNKLLKELTVLSQTIDILSSYIKEEVNEHGSRTKP